jgi:hypothetical protein
MKYKNKIQQEKNIHNSRTRNINIKYTTNLIFIQFNI